MKAEKYKKANSFNSFNNKFDRYEIVKNKIKECYNNNQDNEILKLIYDDLFFDKESKFFTLDQNIIEEIYRIDDNNLKKYLLYRYSYQVYPQKKVLSKYPPTIQIEPTSICNYRCVFCYQTDISFSNKKNGFMGQMKLDLFKKIIDELENNTQSITFASRGEPTLNRDFAEMLAYTKDKFLATKLNTNGYSLNEKIINAILDSNIQTIVFSIDSASEDEYKKFRVNGNFNKVLNNIKLFNEIKKSDFPNSKIISRVSGVKYSGSQNFTEMDNFWSKIVDQVSFVNYVPWENVYISKQNDIIESCSDLWRRMFIWWDGKIGACDVDYKTELFNLNINNRTIESVWNSSEYNNLRKMHLNKKRACVNPCSKCVVV